MTKIYLLGGGNSTEREVSLRSAKAVYNALIKAGFEVVNLDPIDMSVLDAIPAGSIVFPILHGTNGEDGVIQRELESRKMLFLGSGSESSAICFNKWEARTRLEAVGIPFAKAELLHIEDYDSCALTKEPHVLKVHEGGSSIGVLIVRDVSKIDASEVDDVFHLDATAVVEELIEGVEVTVPVLDGKALPVIEIRPPDGDEFDYENKYNGETLELCPPQSVSQQSQEVAQSYAELAHKTLGCKHLSRSDFIVRPDGSVVMLEINTMPGMTDQSLYPKSAKVAGIEFPELMRQFVDMIKRDNKD